MNPLIEFLLVSLGLPILAVIVLGSIATFCFVKYCQYAERETVIEPIVSSYRNAKVGYVLRAKP